LYVYTSNESQNIDVFFDNLQVTHVRGPIVEETHYYPFGLAMSGISSKAVAFGLPQNRKGFNGNELQSNEFSDGSGLEAYDFNARMYDQQLGRFMQIDPLSDKHEQEKLSPYQFGNNSPAVYKDPDGKVGIFGAIIGAVIGGVSSVVKSVVQDGWSALGKSSTWKKAGVNAVAGAIVGATGGLGAGLVATATTTFGASLAEDAIDHKKLDFKKAAFSSFVSTATFGIGKYAGDKLSSVVRSHWWNRGNTNAFMRYLGRSPTTNVGQLVDRVVDITGLGNSLAIDKLFPSQNVTSTLLPEVIIYGKKSGNSVKWDEQSIENAVQQIYENIRKQHE
jgi:RHS repeat-associated protein